MGTTAGLTRRRALVTGVAWSVPAIVVAEAAPAFAASACLSVAVALDNSQRAYDQITITNTGSTTIPVTARACQVVCVSGLVLDGLGESFGVAEGELVEGLCPALDGGALD